jgi:hypothetical protein
MPMCARLSRRCRTGPQEVEQGHVDDESGATNEEEVAYLPGEVSPEGTEQTNRMGEVR